MLVALLITVFSLTSTQALAPEVVSSHQIGNAFCVQLTITEQQLPLPGEEIHPDLCPSPEDNDGEDDEDSNNNSLFSQTQEYQAPIWWVYDPCSDATFIGGMCIRVMPPGNQSKATCKSLSGVYASNNKEAKCVFEREKALLRIRKRWNDLYRMQNDPYTRIVG